MDVIVVNDGVIGSVVVVIADVTVVVAAAVIVVVTVTVVVVVISMAFVVGIVVASFDVKVDADVVPTFPSLFLRTDLSS